MTRENLQKTLMIAGILPFLLLSTLACSPLALGISRLLLLWMMLAYSAIILAFLAGIHWGQILSDSAKQLPNWLILTSNAAALVAWSSLLLPKLVFALIVLVCGFIIQLLIDRTLYQQGALLASYWRLRKWITLLVVTALLLPLLLTLKFHGIR